MKEILDTGCWILEKQQKANRLIRPWGTLVSYVIYFSKARSNFAYSS